MRPSPRRWALLLAAFFASLEGASAQIPGSAELALEALQSAYPDEGFAREANDLVAADGTRFLWDDGVDRTPQQRLDDPTIVDMFREGYPADQTALPASIPDRRDPGRVRVQAFFEYLYGSTEAEVRSSLVSVPWIPSMGRGTLRVTGRHGVAEALRRVSDELVRHPELWSYLAPPGGAFNWRPIAGTSRLSVHSFGAAIDIAVPPSDYWRDQATDEAASVTYRNRIPLAIVQIFEKQGFIWGGWWYHFDTMHFEYRPELLAYARLLARAASPH